MKTLELRYKYGEFNSKCCAFQACAVGIQKYFDVKCEALDVVVTKEFCCTIPSHAVIITDSCFDDCHVLMLGYGDDCDMEMTGLDDESVKFLLKYFDLKVGQIFYLELKQ